MSAKKLLNHYSLKWNPFLPDLPTEALFVSKQLESFLWRMENLVQDGGFALITGDPGNGKSVALRLLSERLGSLRDVKVGVLTRPQSRIGDFYRELGEVFDLKLSPSNRYGGFKLLRERWQAHMEAHIFRPVLCIDEAQELGSDVLNEIRILSSAQFDSISYLTVILCGDSRLPDLFRQKELIPLGSRIRTRLVLDYMSRDELRELLQHNVTKAGNARLLSDELLGTLVDHAGGNCRTLMNLAGELLMAGLARDGALLDEKLYLEVFQLEPARSRARAPARTHPKDKDSR